MRRKTRKTRLFLISFLFLLILATGYAYLETTLKISGYVTGYFNNYDFIIDNNSNPYLEINNYTVNNWYENKEYKYQFSFKVKNIGNITFDNFNAILTFNDKITNVTTWNYDYEYNKEILKLIKDSINFTPNYETEVSFIVTSKNSNLKLSRIKLETISNQEINDKIIVTFIKSNSWGNYTIQYNVNVKNNSDKKINSWYIEVDLGNAIFVSGWNGKFEQNNNILKINNETHNGTINSGNTVTFGIQLNADSPNYIPSNYVVKTR